MRTYDIDVTRADIRRGARGDSRACAVALAASRALGQPVLADGWGLTLDDGREVEVPKAVQQFMVQFDCNRFRCWPFLRPISFSVTFGLALLLVTACHGSPLQPTHISAPTVTPPEATCGLPSKPTLAKPQVEPAHHVNFAWDADLPAILTVMGTLANGQRYQDTKTAQGGRYVWVDAPAGDYTAFVAVQNGCGWSDGSDAVLFRVDESGVPSAPLGPLPSATACTEAPIVAGGRAVDLSVSLPAGVYRVSVETRDAAHARGYQEEQRQEQVAVYAGGLFLGASADIPNSQTAITTTLGVFTLPALSSVRLEHVLKQVDGGNFHSIHGACLTLEGL